MIREGDSRGGLVLAIDLGSTAFKAALFDRQLNEISFGDCRLPHGFDDNGRVELGVEAVVETLRRTLRAVRVEGAPVAAVALTSQAQTFTLLAPGGEPVRPFLSWQDRGDPVVKARVETALPDFCEHCSFGRLSPSLQVTQLARLQPRPEQLVAPLPSFFVKLWSGQLATDNNIAAMSGLYSLGLGDWWPSALEAGGINRGQLPAVLPVGSVAGYTTGAAGSFGLPVGIPIVLAGNDQTAGGYGARLEENQRILLTLGTALVAYLFTPQKPDPQAGLARGPYPGGGYYQMVASNRGGNVINWAKTILADCDSDDRFFTMAGQAEPDCGGLQFDSNLQAGQGGWHGLGLHHGRAEMARSVINSLARQAAVMVSQLTALHRPRQLLAAGGGRFRPLWLSTVSDQIGAEVEATTATPLVGAARMAVEAAD